MSLLDNKHSWKIWDTDGQQTGLINEIIETYVLNYCDGTTLRTVNCELTIRDVTTYEQDVNGQPVRFWNQTVRGTLDAPIIGAGSTATLFIKKGYREDAFEPPQNVFPVLDFYDTGNATTFNFTTATGSIITSGFINLQAEPQTLDESGDQNYWQQTLYGLPQKVTQCSAPPPSCTFEITGTTVTNESSTGAFDGTITIGISGATGTTTFYLDDAPIGQTSNVFTGLTQGTYKVEGEDGVCIDSVEDIIIAAGEFRSGDFTVIEPNSFVASENPIITSLRTKVNGAPIFAQTDFVFSLSVVDNSAVEFNLTNPIAYSATFVSKNFPNKSNYFVSPVLENRAGIVVGSNTAEEIATTFAESVSKDINISRYYFIDVAGDTVTLTAKEATARMTLNTNNVTVGTGIVMNTIADGDDNYEGSIISNYSLYTDVYVGAAGSQYGETLSAIDYDNFTLLELPFSQNNIHRFDTSEVLKTFVSTPKIDLTFTGFTYITSMIRPFFIKYGESYPLVANENTKKKRQKGETGYKWVLNSSLEFEKANDVSIYFTGGSFLTNSPNPLQIQRGQVNFLYFILEKDIGTTLTLKGDIDFYDGTSQSGVTFINISTNTFNAGGVYALNTSYSALGLAAYEASGNTKIKRVTFGIYSDNILYSEERTYRFEIDEQPRSFGVAFKNVLGAYDTFEFIGVVEDSIIRKNKVYTTPRPINPDGSSNIGFKSSAMYNTQVIKTITVNSGWIDSKHFDWLIELMNTNDIYSYTEDYQNYLKVKSYKYKKSSLDDLFELEIVFEQTIQENNITE